MRIIAVSKYAGTDDMKEVLGLGIKDFGENRAEELVEKYNTIGKRAVWHFIGHLQSRKVKLVVPLADYIHSIDSMRVFEKINKEAQFADKIQNVLLEINISKEETKYGMAQDEIDYMLQRSFSFKNIAVCGLMAMAPLTDDCILLRKIFSDLRKILDFYNDKKEFKEKNNRFRELSMGMSNDFIIAVEEGATMVRIGSLIFL